MTRFSDGDDDKKSSPPSQEPIPERDVSDLGDDIGTRVGEGHDPVEDEAQ
ncbi:MAG: hypothetical protein PHO54_00750 [Candidatus Peribacteraceae bacterium]|nr:hypothetical protein [Candidatus Peribacteraceae bacterium]